MDFIKKLTKNQEKERVLRAIAYLIDKVEKLDKRLGEMENVTKCRLSTGREVSEGSMPEGNQDSVIRIDRLDVIEAKVKILETLLNEK